MAHDGVVAVQNMQDDPNHQELGRFIIAGVKEIAPMKVSIEQAAKLIAEARQCAVGPRLCQELFPDTPVCESVFLDELAEGMVQVGKARPVGKEEAVQILARQKGKPIVISKVEGAYQEICRTWHECCLFWNLEKKGVKCIAKMT